MKRLVNYLKNVKAEIGKVTWPSRAKTKEMSILVVVITTVWALYVWVLDIGFNQLMNLIIK